MSQDNLMDQYRDMLDMNHIEWTDKDLHEETENTTPEGESFTVVSDFRVTISKSPSGDQVQALYMCFDREGKQDPFSLGFPDKIEFIAPDVFEGSKAMTPIEAMEQIYHI